MRQVVFVVLALIGCGVLLPCGSGKAAESPREPEAEVQQLKEQLNELEQLLEQISQRLDGMERRLKTLETEGTRIIRVVPRRYQPPPWNGVDPGMMLDALEHQQRFGPGMFPGELRFEPRRFGDPVPPQLRPLPIHPTPR